MRGELSLAFVNWARMRALEPESGTADMRLMSMLQLAQDPERGAGEFLALGAYQLWRKPTSLMDLEEAFRLYVARRPAEARAACDQVARKYRRDDPAVYKLAVLASAWIAELAGDLAGAKTVLEELGRQRGFEQDVDRALALARVCEQIGDEANRQEAIHICEYLLRALPGIEAVAVLGRLSRLHRALGHAEEAERREAEFLDAFRRRMHRPTFEEATEAASRRYVPLPRLQGAGLAPTPPDAAWRGRRRALSLALSGEPVKALSLLSGGRDRLDRKYEADLRLARGERREGLELLGRAVAADPGDLLAAGRLLDELGGEEAGADAVPLEAATAQALLERLDRAVREHPFHVAHWRRLAILHRLLGNAEQAQRSAERAASLRAAAARRERAVGRVLSAAVYHFAGEAKGLIHEVWAARRPTEPGRGGFLEEALGNLTPELAQAVRNIFLSVREYAQAKLPEQTAGLLDYTYSFKVTKEDEPSSGLSAGLPAALAFLSVFLDRPVPQAMAASGIVVADAHDVIVVRPVGEAAFKVRGAYNRNLRSLLLPAGNREELTESPLVPAPITAEIVRFVDNLDEAAEIVFGADLWR